MALTKKTEDNFINIVFKHLNNFITVKAKKGDTLLQAAHSNGVPLEGACEGSLACSTCHVICEKSVFNPEQISDKENDLLDQAFGLKPTSRLGCQIKIDKTLKDKIFEIPRATRNLAVDGYIPKPH
jgi:ferredoxin